eukprot:TCALIF_10182-PA protein Name:"Protein of unknown function" AED:0.33 eAED:0.37 QI:0/0.5/0/0.66/0/0/3/0/113
MKVFGIFLILGLILAPNAVNADCSKCLKLEAHWHAFETNINGGPCFWYLEKAACYINPNNTAFQWCQDEDPKCNTANAVMPQYPPNSGTPEQCDSSPTIDVSSEQARPITMDG